MSTAFVLGVLGSVGGIIDFIGLAIIFALFSPRINGENAPVYTPAQILFLSSVGISSALGIVGAIISIKSARSGGTVMMAAATTALIMTGVYYAASGVLIGFFLANYSWWAVVLLFGGVFGILTSVPHQSGPG